MDERRLRPALTRRAVLATLAAGVCAPALAQSSRSLTFRSESDLLRFPGTVNDQPVTIMVDSGAGNTVIDHRLAARLGVTSTGENHVAGGFTGSQTVQRSNPFRLSFAGINFNGPAALADLSVMEQTGEPLPVVLGRPLFDALGVELDFATHRMTLHQRGTFDAAGWRKTELRLLDGGTRQLEITIEGKAPVWADFDLGSTMGLSLDGAYAQGAGLLSDRLKSTWISAGIEGVSIHQVASAGRVAIAGVEVANVPLAAYADWRKDKNLPANIGFPLISRLGRIFIDYAGNALYVFPDTAPKTPFIRNRLGLALSPREAGGWRVMHVAAGSPGALGGWKIGEEIVAIDGDRTMDRARRIAMANGAPETTVSLTLANGETRKLVLKDYY